MSANGELVMLASVIGLGSSVRTLCSHGVLRSRQIVQVTGDQWPVGQRLQHRFLDTAAVESVWAARMEPAARRRVDRARHVALQDDPLARRCAGSGTGTADSSASV